MTTGTSDPSRHGLRLWHVMLALALLYLWRLGAAPLFDVDEGAFAQASRHMLASGDWGHTYLNGADRFDKPILVYWFQALSMAVFGLNEWAVRLPSALWTLGAAWAVGRAVAREQGEYAGAVTALVFGTALGFMALGRASTADGLLNALLILTGLSLWRFASTRAMSALYWAYFWTALGLLAKGPVAVVVPGGALILWSLFSDRGRTAWAALWAPKGWALALLVAGPWYAYALNRHGMAFIDGFILKHNIERFSDPMEGHTGGLLYYMVIWPFLCLPWTPLMAGVVWRAKAFWRQPQTRFWLVWALWVLGFFSLSGTKLPHYLLYGTAPMLWLMAQVWLQAGRGWHIAVWLGLAFTTVSLAGSGHWLQSMAPQIEDAWYAQLLQSAAPADQILIVGGVVAVAILALGLWGWVGARANTRVGAPHPSRQVASLGTRLMWSATLSMGVYTALVLPWWGVAVQGPWKAMGEHLRTNDLNATQWATHHPSLGFYAQRDVPRRAPQPGELGVTRDTKLKALPPHEIVHGERGVVLARPLPP